MSRRERLYIECTFTRESRTDTNIPPRLSARRDKAGRIVFECPFFKNNTSSECVILGRPCRLVRVFIDANAVSVTEAAFQKTKVKR